MLSGCEFYLFNLGYEEFYNFLLEYLLIKEEVREMR